MDNVPRQVVIVGAGPVGCLAAMAFAKRGWKVNIYEGRPDIRLPSSNTANRSINLTIAHRAWTALEAVDPSLLPMLMQEAIPLRGRMIHTTTGKPVSRVYDTKYGRCTYSINRALLNKRLLDATEASQNVQLFFNHKVIGADFNQKTVNVDDLESGKNFSLSFDLCIGADGSHSIIRREMMKVVRMDFSQGYIEHEYVELKIPAGRDFQGAPMFLLDPNHLHVWPRHTFMLCAFPNQDKTFTCTLFAPGSDFDRLSSSASILDWFKTHFPDVLHLIGETTLVDDFTRNPRNALIYNKVKPYHYKDRVILLGDAAHSVVPFIGQGLNCGLEDVNVLMTLLHEEGVEPNAPTPVNEYGAAKTDDQGLARAFGRYTDDRHDDLVAISKIALDNYIEMRHGVTTISYMFKRTLDNILYSWLPASVSLALPSFTTSPKEPSGWLPLYTMVTFRSDISYATAYRKAVRQTKIVETVGWAAMTSILLAGMWVVWL